MEHCRTSTRRIQTIKTVKFPVLFVLFWVMLLLTSLCVDTSIAVTPNCSNLAGDSPVTFSVAIELSEDAPTREVIFLAQAFKRFIDCFGKISTERIEVLLLGNSAVLNNINCTGAVDHISENHTENRIFDCSVRGPLPQAMLLTCEKRNLSSITQLDESAPDLQSNTLLLNDADILVLVNLGEYFLITRSSARFQVKHCFDKAVGLVDINATANAGNNSISMTIAPTTTRVVSELTEERYTLTTLNMFTKTTEKSPEGSQSEPIQFGIAVIIGVPISTAVFIAITIIILIGIYSRKQREKNSPVLTRNEHTISTSVSTASGNSNGNEYHVESTTQNIYVLPPTQPAIDHTLCPCPKNYLPVGPDGSQIHDFRESTADDPYAIIDDYVITDEIPALPNEHVSGRNSQDNLPEPPPTESNLSQDDRSYNPVNVSYTDNNDVIGTNHERAGDDGKNVYTRLHDTVIRPHNTYSTFNGQDIATTSQFPPKKGPNHGRSSVDDGYSLLWPLTNGVLSQNKSGNDGSENNHTNNPIGSLPVTGTHSPLELHGSTEEHVSVSRDSAKYPSDDENTVLSQEPPVYFTLEREDNIIDERH